MIQFYRQIGRVFLVLAFATLLLAGLCARMFFASDDLLPASASAIPWRVEVINDRLSGRDSTISVLDQTDKIEFEYVLDTAGANPYVKLLLVFDRANSPRGVVDFSHYYKASFRIKCTPDNVATFNLRTFDDKATQTDELGTYRYASHWFDCSNEWGQEDVDLDSLEVPLWWLVSHGLSAHDRSYRLDQVFAVSFDSSQHGQVGTSAVVTVSEIRLHFYRWQYLVLFAVLSLLAWAAFWVWAFRLHTQSLIKRINAKIVQAKPLAAYQKLSIASHKDKENGALLDYLAKHYANPGLSMDVLIDELGMNRKKVNEILKEEMGFTFKTYVNKLRLTEAARLVCDEPNASISEIASSVGYKNVTHFNKIFKEEFGCAPNKFKRLNLPGSSFTRPE